MTGPLFTGLALTAALLLTACADSPTPAEAAPATVTAPATEVQVPIPEEVNALEAEDLTITPQDQGTSTAQLNPPHGEPGHRCEIPVGAPLDGTPAPAPAATSITIPPAGTAASPVMAAPPTSPTSGATGMLNPPHGEPGHDCAVPVGSPLPG